MKLFAVLVLVCAYAGVVCAMRLPPDAGLPTAVVSLAAALAAIGWLFRREERRPLAANRDRDERAYLARLVAAGFALRLVVAAVLHVGELWVYMGGDEGTFHSNGLVFNAYLEGTHRYPLNTRFLGSFEVGFFYLVGGIYHAFGIQKVIPLLITCGIGASTVYLVHGLAGRWGGRVAARRAAFLVAFFPSLVLWSALMVRDSLALFVLVSAIAAADHLRRRLSVRWTLALASCLAVMAVLRTYILVILCVAIVASLTVGRRGGMRSLMTGFALMFALVLVFRGTGLGASELEKANLETLAQLRQYNAMGPSDAGSLGADIDISTPTRALTYLPVGLTYFLLSPLPWQLGSVRQILALPDLIVWYAILPAIVRGLAWLIRRRARSVLALLFTVVGITVLYSLVEGNIGIIFRHRAQIIVPLCVVAGVGHVVAARARERKESAAFEGPFPFHAPPGGPVGPSAGLRLPPAPGALGPAR